MPSRTALMPGTFDPVTYGHLDIIRRGAKLYDTLVIGVSHNPGKRPLLPTDERLRLLRLLCADLPNVKVEAFSGMTVEFARKAAVDVILRGIRTFADFEYEFQLALANRLLGGIETVFIVTSAEKALIRSSLIKEAVSLGADVAPFVPPEAVQSVRRHLAMRRQASASPAPETAPAADGETGLGGHEAPALGRRGSGLAGEGLD